VIDDDNDCGFAVRGPRPLYEIYHIYNNVMLEPIAYKKASKHKS
jgi:hypothetical protein